MTTHPSPAPTFDDVWRTIQELALMSKETDRRMQETDRKMQETDRQIKETDRILKERSEETDRKMQETGLQIKETDRILKERSEETDRIFRAVSKQLGDLGNRLGEFVEHAVQPAVVRLFQAQGIEVHEVHPNATAKRNGIGVEIDLLVVNDGVLVAVECKSKLTQAHVDEHLARMEKLKHLFPLYKDHRALGAVAAMVMSDDVKAYAQERGLYVLCQSGDDIVVGNSEGFTPKAW